jgi:Zn finger protein HypA/HybF involved in hydrogenase expression
MSLIDRLTSTLRRTDADESYTYQCLACSDQFVSEEAHMARVSCPACGAHDVRSVAPEA